VASSDPAGWTLEFSLLAFGVGALVTVAFGVRLTLAAEELARRTGLGQALMGAVFLGALTSLSEIGTSVTAALSNHPELAVTNAVGSIAAQTAFLAFADILHKRANLEHAAASAENLLLAAVLMVLLALTLLASSAPAWHVLHIHPISALLVVAYVFGMRLVSATGAHPMWLPRQTPATAASGDTTRSGTDGRSSVAATWLRFGGMGVVVASGGAALAQSGAAIASHTGISESLVGTLLTGVTSSMPELITALTAVRIGALTLAVSNILGGNAFDTLIVGLADFVYLDGPIFNAIGPDLAFILASTAAMTAVLMVGLLFRERHGLANIGFESVLLLCGYATLVVYLAI
jgi:cation:H+ antiporter